MRQFTTLVLPVIVFALVLSISLKEARATEPDEFVEWALKQGQACDREWSRIAGATTFPREFTLISGKARSYRGYARHDRPLHTAVRRVEWTHPPSRFSHGGDLPFLPLSTRSRNDPSRGTGVLRHPAQARLGIPHKYRRPLNSWVQKRRHFGTRSDFTRPRLTSFGRISRGSGRRGYPTRPAYRPDRPKRIRR